MRTRNLQQRSSVLLDCVRSLLVVAALATLLGCEERGEVREPRVAEAQVLAVSEPAPIVVQPTGAVVTIGARPHAMADLRSLAREGAWGELADHLEDIPPASRDAEWRSLAQQAGLGALTLAGQRGPIDAIDLSEALLARYPALKESSDFMSKRADLGTQAFERCFQKDRWADACASHLKAFVEADPTNQALAFRLGKLVPPRSFGRLAIPAFAVALKRSDDPRCQDPDVKRAVLSGLSLPRAGNEDIVAESIQLGSNVCWHALQAAITDRMGGDSRDYLRNTCPFTAAKGALSSLMAKTCEAALKDSPR
jgi:hypothetical protein